VKAAEYRFDEQRYTGVDPMPALLDV